MCVARQTITAQMSDDACVALATAVLALPVCRDAVDGECSVGCGEIWIPSRDRCPGDQSYPFDTRRGAGLTPMCEAAMAPIVATAPRTMTLSGFTCHPAANGNFQLQSTTRNGRPHWKSGGMNLYWTPAYQNTGGAAWLVVTLEQMLVAGTPESNVMAEMFTASQEPCGFPPWPRLSLALGCC